MIAMRILLVIGGGIAAYKSCELVRLIRKGGGSVTCVMTEAAHEFVTPMTLAALSENPVHTTLWDLRNEVEMGHIQLSRDADLVVVCPATANLLAKMAAGISDDLATTLLLATDKPVFAVPAMNVRMWQHAATVGNVARLRDAGVAIMDPDEGEMACGEFGPGRLPEPERIWREITRIMQVDSGRDTVAAGPASALPDLEQPLVDPRWEDAEIDQHTGNDRGGGGWGGLFASLIPRALRPAESAPSGGMPGQEQKPGPAGSLLAGKGTAKAAPSTDPGAIEPGGMAALPDPLADQPDFSTLSEHRPLYGKHVLITAGPTHEPIDPVRYIANRSSGKQGYAIAAAAAAAGARVTLVSGPVNLPTPPGVDRVDVETAVEMAAAVNDALPADAAVMVAAVADWRSADIAAIKMKKRESAPPALRLTENPDILATLAAGIRRPRLVVGFAAETDNVIEHAKAKRKRKGADWIVANDVSGDVMGGNSNRVHIVTEYAVDSWDKLPKEEVARRLVEKIADELA